MNLLFLFPLFVVILFSIVQCEGKRELLLLTVATEETDGYKRYLRSVKVNGLTSKVLGMGEKWLGGDMNFPGGGQKINLLRKEMEKHKDRQDLVVLFSDSYDVIVTGGAEEILKAFDSLEARIVFGSEDYCWPDKSLKTKYPKVLHGYKYLNSGGFIGYAPSIYEILQKDIKDREDDQLYFTNTFLDEATRSALNIKLDTQAKIFQNLNGHQEDVSLDFQEDDTRLANTVYQTTPIIIHGNGPSKVVLNSLGNYLAKSWTGSQGCLKCGEGRTYLEEKRESEYPKVLIGIFVERPTPFLEEALEKISNLNYPKKKINLFVYNDVEGHEELVGRWVNGRKQVGYPSVKFISNSDNVKNWHARNLAIEKCLDVACDLFFNVDGDVQLDNADTLKLLISYNRPILGAIMTRVGKAWSTFWGAVTDGGFYARSTDYMEIINNERRGIWNVPHISTVYVIWRSVLEDPKKKPNYIHKMLDADMSFTQNLRTQDVAMYAVNLDYYGHLIETDAVTTENLYNDLWQVAANPEDWEQRYLHPKYYEAIEPKTANEMPCTDVYWFPLFTERFCKELIATMENLGEWSGGKNEDPRLDGGYENVPTDDIHMNQIGYEQEWLFILKKYIKPFAEKVYIGYTSEARAIMNFVVRYKPTAQSFLRPHHDSSTYTINVGLNNPGIDYEGGGSNFIRQNCSVTATKIGWSLMHPGRLTHYHEGLKTTKGTRYIMVSFIDP